MPSGSNAVKIWRQWSIFLLMDCCGWVVVLVLPVQKSVGDWLTGNAFPVLNQVCGWLGQELGSQGASRKQNGLPPMVNVILIATAKWQSARGASHQPVFLGSCLTISNTYLVCPAIFYAIL